MHQQPEELLRSCIALLVKERMKDPENKLSPYNLALDIYVELGVKPNRDQILLVLQKV
jgi:hypothetical protein